MDRNYNKLEHLELLQKKSEIGSLNHEDFGKLLGYSVKTTAHLDWCIREHYLELLENFRKGKIEACDFCISFEKTGKLTSDIREILESNLILLSANDKSLGFSDLLEEVFDTCYTYFQDVEFGYENYEVDFQNSVEEIYLKIENYLNEE